MAQKEKKSDYVPHGDKEFEPWFKFMVQYVTERCTGNAPPWKHILKASLDTLSAAYMVWTTAYAKCLEPHAKLVTVAKDWAKKKATGGSVFISRFTGWRPRANKARVA